MTKCDCRLRIRSHLVHSLQLFNVKEVFNGRSLNEADINGGGVVQILSFLIKIRDKNKYVSILKDLFLSTILFELCSSLLQNDLSFSKHSN
jgi:hypothetical protein